MKFLVALIALVTITSIQAFECSKNEAQFIGSVKESWISYDDHGVKECAVKIQFSDYKDSVICPIGYDVAAEAEILDLNCSLNLQVGSPVSGYLVEKNGVIVID